MCCIVSSMLYFTGGTLSHLQNQRCFTLMIWKVFVDVILSAICGENTAWGFVSYFTGIYLFISEERVVSKQVSVNLHQHQNIQYTYQKKIRKSRCWFGRVWMVGYSRGYWPGTLRPKYNTHFNAHISTQQTSYHM